MIFDIDRVNKHTHIIELARWHSYHDPCHLMANGFCSNVIKNFHV